MPDLSGSNAPFGARPWGNILRQRMYSITTAPALAFYHGDIVGIDGSAAATPAMGTLANLEEDTSPASGGVAAKLVGAILALFDENMDPVMYIAASEAGNSTIAGHAMVADHPMQEFIMQEDGNGQSIQVAEIALNADFIVGSGGSTTTGLSSHMIDSSTVISTSTLDLKIHNIHPEDTISSAGVAGNYARFIVSINAHAYGSNTVGT